MTARCPFPDSSDEAPAAVRAGICRHDCAAYPCHFVADASQITTFHMPIMLHKCRQEMLLLSSRIINKHSILSLDKLSCCLYT